MLGYDQLNRIMNEEPNLDNDPVKNYEEIARFLREILKKYAAEAAVYDERTKALHQMMAELTKKAEHYEALARKGGDNR